MVSLEEIIRENIKVAREGRGLTQGKLAELLGISQNHLSQLESGKRKISVSVLDKYADTLNIPYESLLFDYKPSDFKPGETIKWIRERRGISKEALADLLGVSPQKVEFWEKADESMDIGTLEKIAMALSTTVHYILGATYDPERVEDKHIPKPFSQKNEFKIEPFAAILDLSRDITDKLSNSDRTRAIQLLEWSIEELARQKSNQEAKQEKETGK
jgi:transcriptional regulator with XRE-family HTH domain